MTISKEGIITNKGSIIDATFVTVDKRHTTKKDDKSLKEGDCPHDLHAKCAEKLESGEIKDDEHVFNQLDFDARWTKKNNESFFGYKDHVKCDRESKIKIISKRRCRIEHIFGYMTRFMGGLTTRCHGIKRAYRDICNKNLAHDLKCYACVAGWLCPKIQNREGLMANMT